MLAHRHAARCPQCAAARAALFRCETAMEDVRAAFLPYQAIVAAGGRRSSGAASRRRIGIAAGGRAGGYRGRAVVPGDHGRAKGTASKQPQGEITHLDVSPAREVVDDIESGGEMARLADAVDRLDADLQRFGIRPNGWKPAGRLPSHSMNSANGSAGRQTRRLRSDES